MFGFFRRRRIARHLAVPFPEAHRALMEAHVPLVATLSPDERARLEDLVKVFLAEKRFEAAQGLVLDDAMRVSVATQACVLWLGFDDLDVYPDLERVVLYPAAYVATRRASDGVVVTEREEVRLGESWDHGVVVLAWDAVRDGARDLRDGRNVVYHEFAHQLDQHFGDADGAPALHDEMCFGEWAAALGKEFENLEQKAEDGRRTLLDHYGATHPAEFFAVATEAFFEKSAQMKLRKPALYAQLAAYYRQDPAARVWIPDDADGTPAASATNAAPKTRKRGSRKAPRTARRVGDATRGPVGLRASRCRRRNAAARPHRVRGR